jgi:CMP-N,N'-diacetyllegionaminic acid synthase
MCIDGTFLAIIPARAGSKGIRNKNIQMLNGKPLIAYTIEAAVASGIFDKVIVSTESKRISEISRSFGAEIPFQRPVELTTDTAKILDVILHALNFFSDQGIRYDYFSLLQPTSPLRTKEDIIGARDLLLENQANAVVSACEVDHPPHWCNTLPKDLSMDGFITQEIQNQRRQDLQKFYRVNGAIYLARTAYFLKYKDWFKEKSYAYLMPGHRSIDIDIFEDLKFSECVMKLIADGVI